MLTALGTSKDGAERGRGLVLVAEDDEQIRTLTARFLTSMGYVVVEAADGRAAVDLARGSVPDIILLDIDMPGKNGMEVLGELAPGMPNTGFIMVTGNGDEQIALACLRLGAFDYVSKPVELKCLVHSMKVWLLIQSRVH